MTVAAFPADFPLPDVGTLSVEPFSDVSQASIPGIPKQRLWAEPNERMIISAHQVTGPQAIAARTFWRDDLKEGCLPFSVPWLRGKDLTFFDPNDPGKRVTSEGTRFFYPEGGRSSLDYNRAGFTGWTSVCLFTDMPRVIQSNKSEYKLLVELRFRATYQRI